MKLPETKSFFKYIYDNFIANFTGFIIGMAATRLVSHFFVTRSIKSLWGLAARKTVIDKKPSVTLNYLFQLSLALLFFKILSKWIKKKMEELYLVL